MVHYFYGDDTYAARQAIGEVARKQHATLRWLDREDLEVQSLDGWLGGGTGSLFGAQLFVVRDASQFPVALQEDIVACVERGLHGEYVVWDRGQADSRSLIFRQLKRSACKFIQPSVAHAVRWVMSEVQRRGGTVQDGAARVLVERVGCDKWRLGCELDKLLLTSETITEQIVIQAVPPAAEAEIFSTLEALVRGEAKWAVSSIETLLAEYSEFYVLVMLMYQFRTLLIVRAGLEAGKRVHDIVREGKLKQFAVEKNLPYAKRFSRPALVAALTKILATEFAIKQGKVDARTGLMMLVLGLAGQQHSTEDRSLQMTN